MNTNKIVQNYIFGVPFPVMMSSDDSFFCENNDTVSVTGQNISQTNLQNVLNETIRRWKKCLEVNRKHVEHLLK